MGTNDVLGVSAGGRIWSGTSGVTLQIDHDTVMPAIRLILDEARRFTDFAIGQLPAMKVKSPTNDPVSQAMAEAMNKRLWDGPGSFYVRCWDYAEKLVELAEAAKTYGHAENDIRAMFAGATLADTDEVLERLRRRGTLGDGDTYVV